MRVSDNLTLAAECAADVLLLDRLRAILDGGEVAVRLTTLIELYERDYPLEAA